MPIVIAKPAKSLPKSLTDMTAGTMYEDPISMFASKIEKVDSRMEVDNIMKGLADAIGFSVFYLGGAVVRAHELFATKKSEFEDYERFRDYIEAAHGIRYHKAMHAAQIYRKVLDLNLPWSEFDSIGWTKVRLVLDVVTKENIKQWIANAKAMNNHSLNHSRCSNRSPFLRPPRPVLLWPAARRSSASTWPQNWAKASGVARRLGRDYAGVAEVMAGGPDPATSRPVLRLHYLVVRARLFTCIPLMHLGIEIGARHDFTRSQ